jgi:hypothetical protein
VAGYRRFEPETMSTQYDPGTTYNTFGSLLQELDGFIDTAPIELTFDGNRRAYLCGPGFREELTADPSLHRLVREEMRKILVKHLGLAGGDRPQSDLNEIEDSDNPSRLPDL